MKERPIIFSAPMVRAILGGHKTMTRRVVKVRGGSMVDVEQGIPVAECVDGETRRVPCPYGQPGDRLWVRESWAVQRAEPCLPHERDWQELISPTIRYLADGATRRIQGDRSTGVGVYRGAVEKGRPSIHMPRWASRITLEITGVRVERLQDITPAHILAEGVQIPATPDGQALIDIGTKHGPAHFLPNLRGASTDDLLRAHWAALWVQLNGIDSWDANPWVWVIEFATHQPDATGRAGGAA